MSTFLLYASDVEWYAEASQQLCRGALAAMQRRDSSPLELDFLIQNRCYYVSELFFVDFLGLD